MMVCIVSKVMGVGDEKKNVGGALVAVGGRLSQCCAQMAWTILNRAATRPW